MMLPRVLAILLLGAAALASANEDGDLRGARPSKGEGPDSTARARDDAKAPSAEDEPTATPAKGETIAAPATGETTAVPAEDKTTAAPAQDETTTKPAKDETTTAPAKDEIKAVTAKDENKATPAKDETTAAPAKDETTATPAKDETKAAPAKDETTATPAKDEIKAVTAKDETKAVPAKDETTAAPAKGETTAAPTEDSAASILLELWHALLNELHSHTWQWLNALVAFLCGIALLLDSDRSFRVCVVLASALFSCALAQSELANLWELSDRSALSLVIGLQVAMVVGYSVYVGIAGALNIVVAAAGLITAFLFQGPLVDVGVDQLENKKWVVVVYYAVFGWGALLLYRKSLHRHVLAVLCTISGGALVTASLAWTCTECYLRFVHGGRFAPAGAAWIDFLLMLWRGGEDFGLLAGSGYRHNMDLIADRTVWFLLFVCGIVFQCRRLRVELKDPSRAAAAREGLRAPLIECDA